MWLKAERGTIDDYDDYESLKDEEVVENYEEFEKMWHEEYPDEISWYHLVTIERDDYRAIFLGRELIYQSRILDHFRQSQSKNYSSGNWGSKKVIASNKYVTKDIKVDNFKKISVAGSPDVTFTQKSGRPEVEVYTSDNIVDLLDIKVKDNTLYIGFKKDVNVSYKKLEVRVSAETLNGISVAGSLVLAFRNTRHCHHALYNGYGLFRHLGEREAHRLLVSCNHVVVVLCLSDKYLFMVSDNQGRPSI